MTGGRITRAVAEQPTLPGLEMWGLAEPAAMADARPIRGRPLDHPLRAKTIRHFWRRVVRTPDCWFWVGAISSPDGYGRITFLDGPHSRTMGVHRFALLLSDEHSLSEEVVAEHVCNETLCVRVDEQHLHAGTQAHNLAWAVASGRHLGPRPGGGDPRGPYGRAVAIRAALRHGYHPERLQAALSGNEATASLFRIDPM